MRLFLHHAYSVIFGWVLIEQAGVPIPSFPIMIAAGTMSAAHKLHVSYSILLILLACLVSDSLWYMLGKRFGTRFLQLLCKFSLEADNCVTNAQTRVTKRGPVVLLFSKWVPGLNTMAAPIAGQARIPYGEFLTYDLAGTLLWASAWLFAGRFIGDLVRRSHELLGMGVRHGAPIILLLVVAVFTYRFVRWRLFLNELRGLRLEPGQLMAMIGDADRIGKQRPFIVDLRHPIDVRDDPQTLPGALHIPPEELVKSRALIPQERDIVLFCTCPSEETSARIALQLRKLGVRKVRPLRGGLQGWRDAGFPVDAITRPAAPPATQIVALPITPANGN
ncbi:VTT domain-containing protein [Granulicella cerasi]|uniref:VTT domain-containing protein n=1 Tax=Granulicella cerasi TaxID=741063 RepID=A0ABW1ZDJ1_9BACT|nr:VTT domain-containing protein [Granulicella cerasi]